MSSSYFAISGGSGSSFLLYDFCDGEGSYYFFYCFLIGFLITVLWYFYFNMSLRKFEWKYFV